tara:strand:- start:2999 stop:3796 length:798 start_codon:yes stop_codon:yes gene_type:complete
MEEVKTKTIAIKPVIKSKFSGLSSYSNTKTTFEGAQLGLSGYKTGLSKKDEEYFEAELGKPKGFFGKDNSVFWGSMLQLSLPNDKTFYFAVNSVMDELKLRVIMERSDIANNELELARNPQILFYIVDEEAKAKMEEVVIDSKMEAQEAFSDLTIDEKKGYLKLYGKKGVDDLSDRMIKTELFKEVDKDSKKFLKLTQNPDIKLMISIQDMLEQGTLVKKNNYYNFENEVIGNSIDSVISYFKDIKNQSMKIAAEQVTKNSKKGK